MQKFDNLGESLHSINWKDANLKSFEKNFYRVNYCWGWPFTYRSIPMWRKEVRRRSLRSELTSELQLKVIISLDLLLHLMRQDSQSTSLKLWPFKITSPNQQLSKVKDGQSLFQEEIWLPLLRPDQEKLSDFFYQESSMSMLKSF